MSNLLRSLDAYERTTIDDVQLKLSSSFDLFSSYR